MANGSFGLSGLPTAPTTVGSAPNNPFTPVSVAVNSTAGFQSGDLVYNYAGDIGPVPGNFASTGTFPVTDTVPTVNPNTSYGELFASPITKGIVYRDRASAKLTSGNIVIVYLLATPSGANNPYFKVVNENGDVIVTDTQISSVIGGFGNIAVCALTGGGFAVGWRNPGTSNPYYAIYTNTGTVTLAATQDTGITLNSSDTQWLQLISRPNGSWIFAVLSSTGFINHKVYSALGVQVYNWTQVVTSSAATYWWKYAVRSDGSFIILSINASSQISYTVYSSTNTVALATAAFPSPQTISNVTNAGGIDVFSNDIAIVTFAGGGNVYYVTISAANVASAPIAYTGLSNVTVDIKWAKPKVLANGNYIVSYVSGQATVNQIQAFVLSYIVFNASHVAQQTFQVISSFSMGPNYGPDTVETANFINFLGAPSGYDTSLINSWSTNGAPTSLQWAKVSPSTYLTIKSSSISALIGNTSAQPVSGYARAGSTPTSAAFLASTTGNVSLTTTAGAVVVAQTTIDTAGACDAMDTASLSDGSCLILYKTRGGTGSVKLAVISPTGVLTSTQTVVTTSTVTSSIQQGTIKLAVLTDGKIAILYQDDSLGLCVSVMSSTYSVLTTPVTITASAGADGSGLASLSNGRFAVAYRDSGTSHVYYRVYNSSLTLLAGPTAAYTSSTSNVAISCASYPSGFLINWTNTGNTAVISVSLIETSTNTFTLSNLGSFSNAGARIIGQKMVSATNGNVFTITYASTGGTEVQLLMNVGGSINFANRQFSSFLSTAANGTASTTFALSSYNEPVVFSWVSSTVLRMVYTTSSNGITTGTYFNFTSIFSLPSANTSSVMVGGTLAGHNVLLALLNSSGFLTYTVINPTNYTYTLPLVAGVTPANPVAIGNANGFSLVGVSSTDAPANGSGTVVINGPAQLSSSYPSTTPGQSFDFGNNVTFGAAGTVSGRNVNLIGNV